MDYMRTFKFGEGFVKNILNDVEPYQNVFNITGYLNCLFYNRVVDFAPYKKEVNGYSYESTLSEFSYNEWREIIERHNDSTFYFYAVLKPAETDLFPEEVIELNGHTESFPLFAIMNPNRKYFYEYIKVPNNPA
jgi:hypothetical protein